MKDVEEVIKAVLLKSDFEKESGKARSFERLGFL